ncbi:LADA_0E13344g1_1 [Lachancea dasiensis]|uniref:Dynactin subunit 5 n=1 Tax=Lachancea dasiensis TaxID=1072105 RepID=A0A1G4JFL7_9SACH|nr:LADA_0E13344g1_1 [Lachancea dasiensis]
MDSGNDWIQTRSGSRISRRAQIRGQNKVILAGMCVLSDHCTLKGDVPLRSKVAAAISMGEFCIIEKGCWLEPPQIGHKSLKGNVSQEEITAVHGSLTLGSFVLLRENCKIQCSQIGRSVVVGHNALLSLGCEIGDVVIVDPHVKVPAKSKIPSFSRVRQHARFKDAVELSILPNGFRKCIETWCKFEYLGIPVDVDEILSDN